MSKVSKRRKEALCFNLIFVCGSNSRQIDLGVTPGILKVVETSKSIGSRLKIFVDGNRISRGERLFREV